MPVYEEKLMSPLAIRYSQEHVRKTFRNGQNLEDVIELVTVREVEEQCGPYDLILRPPFPNIEVVRWAPPLQAKLHSSSGIFMPSLPPCDEMHWFTKDNQRLYILQRVAAKHWPKKVACEVDILFAVPSELLKRYDSSTAGLLAALGEPGRCESASIWNWGRAVTNPHRTINIALERFALTQLEKDDASCTLAELVSIPKALKIDLHVAEVGPDDAETFADSTSSEQVMPSPNLNCWSTDQPRPIHKAVNSCLVPTLNDPMSCLPLSRRFPLNISKV